MIKDLITLIQQCKILYTTSKHTSAMIDRSSSVRVNEPLDQVCGLSPYLGTSWQSPSRSVFCTNELDIQFAVYWVTGC